MSRTAKLLVAASLAAATLVGTACDPGGPAPTPSPTTTSPTTAPPTTPAPAPTTPRPVVTHTDPPPPIPDPTASAHQLAAQEQTLTWTPQPDGSLKAVQRIVFDAGEGRPASDPLTATVAAIRLETSSDHKTSWYARPELHDAGAADLTDPAAAHPLTIDAYPSTYGKNWTLLRFRRSDAWSAGRHTVEFTYRWTGTWVEIAGKRQFVLPHLTLNASWYDPNDRSETVRLRTTDRATILCRGDNPNYDQSDKPCPGQKDGEVSAFGDFMGLGSTSANSVYYFLRSPAGVTAAPTPAVKETK